MPSYGLCDALTIKIRTAVGEVEACVGIGKTGRKRDSRNGWGSIVGEYTRIEWYTRNGSIIGGHRTCDGTRMGETSCQYRTLAGLALTIYTPCITVGDRISIGIRGCCSTGICCGLYGWLGRGYGYGEHLRW